MDKRKVVADIKIIEDAEKGFGFFRKTIKSIHKLCLQIMINVYFVTLSSRRK